MAAGGRRLGRPVPETAFETVSEYPSADRTRVHTLHLHDKPPTGETSGRSNAGSDRASGAITPPSTSCRRTIRGKRRTPGLPPTAAVLGSRYAGAERRERDRSIPTELDLVVENRVQAPLLMISIRSRLSPMPICGRAAAAYGVKGGDKTRCRCPPGPAEHTVRPRRRRRNQL